MEIQVEQKIFYCDVETTGLYPTKHDIVQLAFIIEVDGIVQEVHNLKMQPFSYDNISQDALDITGLTLDKIKAFDDPREQFDKFLTILEKYIDKFNKNDKFQVVGQNVQFDMGFLKSFFKKNDEKYFGSYFEKQTADPYEIFKFMRSHGLVNYPNLRLGTICSKLKIPLEAHDALSDITATRELYQRLGRYLKSGVLTHLTKPVALEHPDTTEDMFGEE